MQVAAVIFAQATFHQHVTRWALAEDLSSLLKSDVMSVHGGEFDIMHHRDYAAACPGIARDDFYDLQLVTDIEARNRFIEDASFRARVINWVPDLRQSAGDLDALQLRARKLLIKAHLV
ncbi:MAG: hypothetical protein AAFY25_11445 [Pseudomonadota bacterium]